MCKRILNTSVKVVFIIVVFSNLNYSQCILTFLNTATIGTNYTSIIGADAINIKPLPGYGLGLRMSISSSVMDAIFEMDYEWIRVKQDVGNIPGTFKQYDKTVINTFKSGIILKYNFTGVTKIVPNILIGIKPQLDMDKK